MSIDSLVGQIERLTLEVPELGQKTSEICHTFAREKVVAIKRLLTGNRAFSPSRELVQKIIQLIDSSESDDSVKGFRSQLARSYNIEESSSLLGQIMSAVGSIFSIKHLLGRNDNGRWRISENYLKRIGKDRFYEHVKKVPVTTLIIDRVKKPPLVYTGKNLQRLVSHQAELSTLIEEVTLRLDTGETIGMMGKALYSLCTQSRVQESLVSTTPLGDFTHIQEAIENISLNGFCEIVSKVTTGNFDEPALPGVLLRIIVSHLPNQTFLNCRRVCKAWHHALEDQSAWVNRIFPMNISLGPMPAHAIFFSPISYKPEEDQWQAMRHRIKDIVFLAKNGHIGAQIELAQRVFLNKGSYELDRGIALDWIRQSKSAKSLYARGVNCPMTDFIRDSAYMGYAPAQNKLGRAYQEGDQVPIDLKEAEKWYLLAAGQGYMYAENNLGALYLDSNKDESLRWSLRAARKGHPEAQCRAASLLYERAKNSNDLIEVIGWLQHAADQNFIDAFYSLATIYRDNEKLRNYKEAARYFELAASEQHSLSQYCLGLLHYNGHGVPKNAQEAANWYLLAAEQGVPDAQYRLGKLHYEGDGMPEDFAEAFNWLLRAAEQGHLESQFYVGIMYKDGKGVVANNDEACKWLTSAADNGHVESSFLLGNAYRNGIVIPENLEQAFKRFSFAAERGHREAQYCLGLMYADGEGVEADHEEAAKWYHLSAKQGCTYAQYMLGHIYQYGIGVAQDIKIAIKWYEFAALDGVERSDKENRELEELIAELRSRYLILSQRSLSRDLHEICSKQLPQAALTNMLCTYMAKELFYFPNTQPEDLLALLSDVKGVRLPKSEEILAEVENLRHEECISAFRELLNPTSNAYSSHKSLNASIRKLVSMLKKTTLRKDELAEFAIALPPALSEGRPEMMLTNVNAFRLDKEFKTICQELWNHLGLGKLILAFNEEK